MERVTVKGRSGRPSRFSEAEKDQIVRLFNSGINKTELANEYKCSVSTIAKVLRERR